MKNFKLSLLFYSLVLGIFSSTLYAEKRVALVIGNSAYPSASLKNPVNDAADMAALLKQKDFLVTLLTDANKRDMEEAIRSFNRKLIGKNTVGLFYFAGHGIEMDGVNYLIPVNANIKTGVDAKYESVDAGRILDGMENAGNNLNMVILDACRNNPFERRFRSGSQGLARMDAPKGSLMLYATSPGDVAADGDGRNGLFTKHLLAAMRTPNLKVEDVFKQTAIKVNGASSGIQLPWQSGVILGDFYFSTKIEVNPVVGKAAESPVGAQQLVELEYWNSIKGSSDADYFKAYLEQFGEKGQFHRLAKLKLDKLTSKKAAPELTQVPAPVPVKPGQAYLTINTWPSDAQIKFLNASEVYQPDMELKPGRYFIEISKSGYRYYTNWIELSAGNNIRSVTLKPQQIQASTTSNPYPDYQMAPPPPQPRIDYSRPPPPIHHHVPPPPFPPHPPNRRPMR